MTILPIRARFAVAGTIMILALGLMLSTNALANSCDEGADPSEMVAGMTPSCELQSTTTNDVTTYSCKKNATCTKKCILKVTTESEGDNPPVVVDRKCLCKASTGTPATMEVPSDIEVDELAGPKGSALSW